MTKDEADELAADLRAISVDVREVKRNELTGGWEVVFDSEHTHTTHAVLSAKLFRESVHMGLAPSLPKGALDKRPNKPTT